MRICQRCNSNIFGLRKIMGIALGREPGCGVSLETQGIVPEMED